MYNLKLARTLDVELIRSFMLKPEIWNDFTDDMGVKENYFPAINHGTFWLKVMDGDQLVGTILIENVNLSTLNVHPCLLKSHRIHIMKVFDGLFKIFLDFPDWVNKMVVTIPFCRKIVYNTAIKKGFIEEGVNRKSFLKDGVFHDQWYLGLTREEIRSLVWEKQ